MELHGILTTQELKKQPTHGEVRTHSEVADHEGRTGWTGKWDSELIVDYI